MRTKDDKKITALFEATVKLVNEIGFTSSSVSKIAKEAKVSPATIYVYYENKEELLASTYVEIKRNLSTFVMQDFDDTLPVRDILQKIWFNIFRFALKYPDYIRYTDQFSNSPYSSLVDREELEQYTKPFFKGLERGIEQKIIKNVNSDILSAFIYYPITFLSNKNMCKNFELTEENIESAFTLAWDAIKV